MQLNSSVKIQWPQRLRKPGFLSSTIFYFYKKVHDFLLSEIAANFFIVKFKKSKKF